MKSSVKKTICAILSLNCLLSFFICADAQPLKEQFEIPKYNGLAISDNITYAQYLREHEGETDAPGEAAAIDLTQSQYYKQTDDGNMAIVWDDASIKSIVFYFTVHKTGFFDLEFDFMTLPSTVTAPRRKILVDDQTLFKELNTIDFKRCWTDDGKPVKNEIGDDVRPPVKELQVWQTTRICDINGMYDAPLKIALSKGLHKITLQYVFEPMAIKSIRLVSPEKPVSYQTKLAEYRAKGYKNAESSVKVDAEYPSYKSDSSVRMNFCADPVADPNPEGHKIVNVIGGGNWNTPNVSLTYNFHAPESGLYRLNLRIYQKYANGLPVYREIKIDNKVPFQEWASYRVKDTPWAYTSIADDDGNPYLVYLEEGDHSITFTSKITGYAEILNDLNETLYLYSYVIRKITMVTSVSPDPNFDYKLEQKIPDLLVSLKTISDSLDTQINHLKQMNTTKSTSAVSGFYKSKILIDKLMEKPSIIAANLSNLEEAQVTLSSWVTDFSSCDLQIDYFVFDNPDVDPKNYSSSFFQILYYSFKTFIDSFFNDYNAIGSSGGNTAGYKPLSVWISRGKEWGDVLDDICKEEFCKNNKVNFKLNILPSGQLGTSGIVLMALAAKSAPDVILGGDAGLATEYGMREATYDLSKFQGFDETKQQFLPGLLRAYTFRDGVYAIPETMDFSILFYRTDILAELNMKIPETWEDVYAQVLPVLKRNGMDFWYEGGLNTFLFQNGGEYYREGGKKSGLDSPEAINAFKQFTDLYNVYELPVTADFYSRFRTGQIPIGISSFSTFIKLNTAAPEIQNKWGVAMIPGTIQKDGSINRSSSGGSSGCMILKTENTIKDPSMAWNFINWYTSAPTQEEYARSITSYIGPEARWFSANLEAFYSLPWEYNLKDVVVQQGRWLTSQYNVVGGYITGRQVENARVRTVVQKMNYRESLDIAVKDINRELDTKNAEFEMRAAKQSSSEVRP